MKDGILINLFFFLGASVLFVPLFRIIKLGSILGYLVAGMVVGPMGLGLLQHSHSIEEVSEMGVTLLLFIIGLELSPARLKGLKKGIFFDGGVQVFLSTFCISLVCWLITKDMVASIFTGVALSLSSTAFALNYLKESFQLTKSFGQSSLSILIFQDLIIIPVLTILPFFTKQINLGEQVLSVIALKKIFLLMGFLLFTKFMLLPVLGWIKQSQSIEIFVGMTLFIIFGSSLIVDSIGLSKAIGAFVVGIFLSNTDYKTEIQRFTEPIKSMLMGVFFMGFGMSLDFNFLFENFNQVISLTLGFLGLKCCILFCIGMIRFKSIRPSIALALIICQGGEFGLLVVMNSLENQIFTPELAILIEGSITLSLFLAPIIAKLSEFISKVDSKLTIAEDQTLELNQNDEETEDVVLDKVA